MKYIYISFIIFISYINYTFAWADDLLGGIKTWLPGNKKDPDEIVWNVISWLINSSINYIAIIAVLALMISWIMYMLAAWEEEKAKKAKKWLIWSLVWVILSVSALWIIKLLNNITI